MKVAEMLDQGVDEVTDGSAEELAFEGADADNRGGENMLEGNDAQFVVVLGMEGKVVADGDAHTDFHILFDGFGVVDGQHYIEVDAAVLERLLEVAAGEAFRAGEDERPVGDVVEGDGVFLQKLVARRRQQDDAVAEQLGKGEGRLVGQRGGANSQVQLPGFDQLDEAGVGTSH